jgi:hypothetical protein
VGGARRGQGAAGLKGLDPGKLEEAGWGMIFADSADSEPLREALAPLLDLRRAPAGKRRERFFQEFVGKDGLLRRREQSRVPRPPWRRTPARRIRRRHARARPSRELIVAPSDPVERDIDVQIDGGAIVTTLVLNLEICRRLVEHVEIGAFGDRRVASGVGRLRHH